MSEIEKMYKNAGIKPYIYCSKPQLDCNARETGNCKQDCEYYSEERLLTPFTAEKQLELIKFTTSLGVCEIENWNDKGFHFAVKRERVYPTMFLSLSNINLQETLADVINNLWQDLTEEEKQQVKGILE